LPEIEAAITQLPDNNIRQLAAWLEEYLGASQFCKNKICSGSILLPNVQEAG
jgi:hypothetical protein